MKRKRALCMILAVIVLAAGVLTISAIADAGNFSGGSDYGGGDWGGSSDWGGSGGGYIFVGGGDGGDFSWAAVAVILAIVYFIFRNRKRAHVSSARPAAQPVPANLKPISALIEKDPKFSEAEMKEKISNLYVRMQNAWQDKNFEPMRPYMTDALYNQFARQLDELVRAGRTNYVERIAVLDVTLNGFAGDEVNDAITATVSARIVDYTLDDNSGKLVSGSKTAEKFMTYQWTMIRSAGLTTPGRAGEGRDGTVEISCPSCGAPVEINQSARCAYCGSIINARDYDWSISAIKGVSQRTVGK